MLYGTTCWRPYVAEHPLHTHPNHLLLLTAHLIQFQVLAQKVGSHVENLFAQRIHKRNDSSHSHVRFLAPPPFPVDGFGWCAKLKRSLTTLLNV